jgi:hypothetical protein
MAGFFQLFLTKTCPVGAHVGKWKEGGRGRAMTNRAIYACGLLNNPQLFSVILRLLAALEKNLLFFAGVSFLNPSVERLKWRWKLFPKNTSNPLLQRPLT